MMPNADAIALGKQIKAVRKAMGMTQDQLALKSHVSVKYIYVKCRESQRTAHASARLSSH